MPPGSHGHNLSGNFPDSMRGTYHSEIHNSSGKTAKDSFLNSRMTHNININEGFNKTTGFMDAETNSILRNTLTPYIGAHYGPRDFQKLNTIYNARNTKSISGDLNPVTQRIFYL